MVKCKPTMVIIPILVLLGAVFTLAEKSIPGNSLYILKTHIAEPIAGVFSFSKEEKIEWQERIIERRLKEVERLVSTNSLNDKNRLEIEKSLIEKIDQFIINTKYLITNKDSEEEEIMDINLRLEAALNAYQGILSSLLNTKNKIETTKVINTLTLYENNIKNIRENLENSNTKNTENAKEFAKNTRTTAEELLTSTKLLYQKNKVKFPTSAQNDINTRLAEAEKSLEQGNAYVIAEDYAKATDTYNISINQSSEAKLLILTNLIRENIRSKTDSEDVEEGNEEFEE